MGLYWSYTLLLYSPVLCALAVIKCIYLPTLQPDPINPTDRFDSSDMVHESTSQLTQIIDVENVHMVFLPFPQNGYMYQVCTQLNSLCGVWSYIVGSQLQSSSWQSQLNTNCIGWRNRAPRTVRWAETCEQCGSAHYHPKFVLQDYHDQQGQPQVSLHWSRKSMAWEIQSRTRYIETN